MNVPSANRYAATTPVRRGMTITEPETIGAPIGGASAATDQRTESGSDSAGATRGLNRTATAARVPTAAIRAKHLQHIVVRRAGTPYNSAVRFHHRGSPNHSRF